MFNGAVVKQHTRDVHNLAKVGADCTLSHRIQSRLLDSHFAIAVALLQPISL